MIYGIMFIYFTERIDTGILYLQFIGKIQLLRNVTSFKYKNIKKSLDEQFLINIQVIATEYLATYLTKYIHRI